MIRWLLKSLVHEPWAALGSAAAVGAAFVLILLFEAIWAGESDQTVMYIRRTDADVWVMQRGVTNMHMASTFVADWKRDQVARVEGVADATPILYLNSLVRAGTREWFGYVVGLPQGAARGGPWAVAAGSASPKRGEVLLPAIMARLAGVGIGDRVFISDQPFQVAGLTLETYSMVNPLIFVDRGDLTDYLETSGYDSYVLVKAEPGSDPRALARAIQAQVEAVSAVDRQTFIDNDHHMSMQMGVELIGLMTAISGALAVLLVAFTLYTHTARMSRELAVLKALGFRGRHIFASAAAQALILFAAGFAIGLALTYAAAAFAAVWAPQITIHLNAGIALRVSALGLVVALLATALPAWQIARVDPQTVFQG
jgi:putative ABC transport system permease protein